MQLRRHLVHPATLKAASSNTCGFFCFYFSRQAQYPRGLQGCDAQPNARKPAILLALLVF